MNEKDGIFRGIREQKDRDALTAEFRPISGSRTGELAARFDIVIGSTPEDPKEDRFRGGRRPSGV
jgi:protocatechuate 3,4-dioxygenase beta subunit